MKSVSEFKHTFKEISAYLSLPVFCKKTDSLHKVIELMNTKEIGSVLIADDEGNLEGIFTERDVLRKIVIDSSIDLNKDLVEDYMTKSPKTVSEDDFVINGFLLMRLGKFRHLIIKGQNKELRIFSIKDALDYYCDASSNTV